MTIHWLQHVPFEGLGTIATWAARRNHRLDCTRFWANDPLPDPAEIRMLVVMGGPMGVGDVGKHPWLVSEKRFIRAVAERGGVILGICLGAQLLADVLGAAVTPNRHKEIGWFPVNRAEGVDAPLSALFPEEMTVFHWHGDTFALPAGARPLYSSGACRNQGFISGGRIIALQFHPEMTPDGVAALLANCGAEVQPGTWIQSEREIVGGADHMTAAHRVMDGLLDYLEAQCGSGK